MVNIVAISRERHTGKGCQGPNSYTFAARQCVVPVIGAECARTAVFMPIAFIEQSGRFVPVGVMSPVQERNLFVAPNGQWLGNYIPARLRCYPFCLAHIEGSDQASLCIDEDSGWVVDADAETPSFFQEDGSPSQGLKATMDFLLKVDQHHSLTENATAALAEARLIQPWPLRVPIGKEQISVTGLYCIDERALIKLDGPALVKLRDLSALVLAYAQLISMHTVGVFAQMAIIQEQLAQQLRPLPSVSSLFPTDDSGTIQFN